MKTYYGTYHCPIRGLDLISVAQLRTVNLGYEELSPKLKNYSLEFSLLWPNHVRLSGQRISTLTTLCC